ncbi:SDR family NAD(P)-dependent oxidoreductase [Streptomyces sp. AJS327]|uniref:type I polyketide synthase n=1 Tax=Streptomyces sp. AJS327 TaxID=2545265 RepID=UPI0015DE262F|nr:type I polyketide synthase [Streptomyces sp. AJS327]MBA0051258.1 SDR family NAD(P)-dependent oxidoreductase [Streptomyces sp. AJS327]UYV85217.1 polyketide synthase [Streptomyces sp. AJS327]
MTEDAKLLDYLKRATTELRQTRRQLKESEARQREPLAIVAMSCRFPGGVASPEDLWDLVAARADAISDFPTNRGWDLDALYDPDPDNSGTTYVREGGFLSDADQFDAELFGISPREALAMSPQQRLLLETSWQLFERAALDPTGLTGRRIGVFVGLNGQDYATRLPTVPEEVEGYLGIGTAASVVSGRLSYVFGLEGPAVTVDTACSSSLVAMHLAAQALRSGECSLAVAGGATVMSAPDTFVEFSRQRGLAPDGRCKAFAAGADGTSWGEGVGLVLLERLSDAMANGHQVLAVLSGSAVNQDGASNGLTAPNGPSQQRVIRQALSNAGIAAIDVDVVEAHGTGTSLGDPIEADALLATYGQDRAGGRPLWLGSVKSNIGHTQAAAGVAGVIKMVMAMRHGSLPATLHVDEPSPHVDWSSGEVRLLTESVPWEVSDSRVRRAGVSSFGVSGTNAHVILEEAPALEESAEVVESGSGSDVVSGLVAGELGLVPWVVSGRGGVGLRGQAARLAGFVRERVVAGERVDVAGVAAGLVGRAGLEDRAVVVGSGVEGLLSGLDAVAEGGVSVSASSVGVEGVVVGSSVGGKLAVLFTGQGSQFVGMGAELYGRFGVFAGVVDEVCEVADGLLPGPLRPVLFGEDGQDGVGGDGQDGVGGDGGGGVGEGLLGETVFAQVGLVALEVGLWRVLEECGVCPDVLIGHSVGEVSAAVASGVLSLSDAVRLVCARGRLMQGLASGGVMVSVAAPVAEVEGRVEGLEGVWIAAVNGPEAVVLAGEAEAVGGVVGMLSGEGFRTRWLPVSHAFHTPLMDPILEEFAREIAGLSFGPGRIPVVSTVSGGVVGSDFGGVAYWVEHACRPVRFGDAVGVARGLGVRVWAEVGPQPALTAVLGGCEGEVSAVFMRRGRDQVAGVLTGLARLHVHGVGVDWRRLLPRGAGSVELPTYAFQRRRYWLEATASAEAETLVDAGSIAFWEAVERQDLAALGLDENTVPAEVLPALSAWRRTYQERQTVDGWRYHVAWRSVPEPNSREMSDTWLRSTWLVVGHEGGETARLVEMVGRAGARAEVLTVEPGTDRALLADRLRAMSADGEPLAGVLSALTLPGGRPLDHEVSLADSLALLQALGDVGVGAPLWCLTSGAVGTGGTDTVCEPEAAAVWGLGRVACLEHPDRWGGLVDLPSLPDELAYRLLALVLSGATGEDQVAVRDAGLFACRLRRAPSGAATAATVGGASGEGEPGWSSRGTALITGGTGALGGHVARWLAERGVEHVLLLSRLGPHAPGAADLRRDLEALGARVTIRACDISVRAELAEAVAAVPADCPLTTVVHAAAVLDDAPLSAQTPDRLGAVLRAKATSARYLDELTRQLPLTSFVLFSAFGGVLGSAGQGNYAAANAVLDALAEQRRAAGLPATAIAWGAWAGDGMAARSSATALRLRRTGARPMAPDLALAAMGRALESGETTVAVADLDWPRFARTVTAARRNPLLDELPDAWNTEAVGGGWSPEVANALLPEAVRRLGALSGAERNAALLDLVREQAAAVLGHAEPTGIGSERPFRDLGFDSLTGLDLRNRLAAATGLTLPATLVFDHPTVGQLTAHLDSELHTEHVEFAEGTPERGTYLPAGAETDEPIAIVAVGCQLPGGVRSPEELWTLLADGVDAMDEFPTDRGWDLARLFDADADRPGTSYVRHGGFLSGAAEFDAAFFGISPREAVAMDPQQRLLLETSWEVLERAGIDPSTLRGSRTGVFAGTNGQDYAGLLADVPDGEDFAATGNAASVLSGRVAYVLGLEGPAVTVDTACSASLVSIHLASQALRRQECSLALAGGVTVMSTPAAFVGFSRQRGLAPDGRCKPFSARADGTAWGEGVAVLLLERLSDAHRNGHPVLAMVRGSAVNQDGASNGLTAPNGPAQQRVIRAALADSALTPGDVDAVEAHGTGTVLGDPIEAQALIAAYGDRPADRPLRIGSIKSNIGHTQAAAGAAGVLKMVLALRHGTLPRTLHADEASPHVDWTAGEVSLLAESVPWERDGHPRRAGVSSFGVSGTNAHVIIEEAPDLPTTEPGPALVPGPVTEPVVADAELADQDPVTGPPSEEAPPFLLSARDATTLAAQADRLHTHLTTHPRLTLPDVAHSLATTRAALEHRAVVLAPDRDQLLSSLAALGDGEPAPGVLRGVAAEPRVAVLFAGQGSQSVGMGRALHSRYPEYAARLDEVCAAFAPHLDRPLLDVLHAEPGTDEAELLDQTHYTQPALFAVEVALYRLLEGWGLRPDYLLGHSVGELTAAHVAGVLSLPEAARLVAARGQLMWDLPAGGAMLSVNAAPEDLAPLLDGRAHEISVAAVNGPAATVLSGDEHAIRDIAAHCAEQGLKTRRLRVSHAFHSHHMDDMLAAFDDVASQLDLRPPRVPIVSNVTGTALTEDQATSSDYWVRHVREAVQFRDGIHWLHSRGVTVFLELGPDGVLSGMGTECLTGTGTGTGTGTEVAFVPALRHAWPEPRAVTAAIGELHTHGVPLDWSAITTGWGGQRVPLPTYPFRRRRYWPEHTTSPTAPPPTNDPTETRFWTAVDQQDLASLTAALGVDETTPLPELLPALSTWRGRRKDESAVQTWRYRVTWRPLTELPNRPRLSGTWLVVAPSGSDSEPVTASALAALTRCGAHPQLLTVDPADTHADTALRTALTATDHPPAGILSLLPLDRRPHPGRPELTAGLTGTVLLTRTLAETDSEARLWCVTRGAVAADRITPVNDPAQAQIWGLGRVAALEHPRHWGGLADLPSEPDDTSYDRLCAVLAAGTREDQVAIRPTGVLGRRLTRPTTPATGVWQPRGTILVTGGTGGIGAHVARWLAHSGADHLVLASRGGPDSPGAAELAAELGPRVTIAACDVTDRRAVTDLTTRMAAAGHPIRAVFHAAGISRHAPVAATTPEEIADTVAAKVVGATVLHEEFADTTLDAFVLFSSIAAVWGSGGQAAYAAANAHLDALAELRRAQGLVATSVAWGAWANVGMAATEEAAGQLRLRGISVMDPDRAVLALRQALADEEPTITVADVDWKRFTPLFTGARPSPFLSDLPDAAHELVEPDEQPTGISGDMSQRVASLPEADGTQLLLDLVRSEAAAVLGHTNPDEIDQNRDFRGLGFDSLTSIQLRDRLTTATGSALPATLAFDHPTPAALASQLRVTLLGLRPDRPTTTPARSGDTAEPIAIVGMSCRYPGHVASPEDLWNLVATGGDAISAFPSDRGWDLDALYNPDPEHSGTSYAREGGFLAEAGEFDAAFFGISPREALAMDPQQRLLLEATWEVLERAHIDPESLRTSPTGVFVGTSVHDYVSLLGGAGGAAEGHLATGNAASVVSGRLAYVFGLEGPAVTVDTACSSSLVSLHLAAQALRSGECTLALAGGATVMSTPGAFIEFSRQRGLAPDGRCKPFASAADGTGWGEGVGVLLLERLSDAVANGHEVLAVVRGSAVNQDGASNGLTAPNGPSQQRVIRQALSNAGIAAIDVDVVEAHGTGTSLGDPIEAQALLATYGQDRAGDRPLWLGSVKSNIGHSQAASGVAGVIKMVMAMRHGSLPATLHVDEPSPHVDWSAGEVRLLTEPMAWQGEGRTRRAGVSSFGVSGTNAHVILEEPPSPATSVEVESVSVVGELGLVPWVVSGRGGVGLRGQAARLAGFVRECVAAGERVDVAGVAAGLVGRAGLEDRAVVVGSGVEGLLSGLDAVVEGGVSVSASSVGVEGVVVGSSVGGKLAVLFTGQGSQFVGMGAELYGRFGVFAGVVDEVCEVADGLLPGPLRPVLFGEDGQDGVGGDGQDGVGGDGGGGVGEGLLGETVFAQVGLVALEVGLWRVLEECGVCPDVLIGHSVGEVSAAVASGVLSLSDAVRLVCARGVLMQGLASGGVMVSVAAPVAEVEGRVEGLEGVWVAAVNGPEAVVLAGEAEAVGGVVGVLSGEGFRTRWLPVSHAFHTPLMDPILEEFAQRIEGLSFGPGRIPVVSTVSGGVVGSDFGGVAYWVEHACRPVRFGDAVGVARGLGVRVWAEVGPQPALTAVLGGCEGEVSAVFMRRGRDQVAGVLTGLARLHVHGVGVDWRRLLPRGAGSVELPTYAFQRRRYWVDGVVGSGVSGLSGWGLVGGGHGVLGARVSLAGGGVVWVGGLSVVGQSWLVDHGVGGVVVVPGTAFVDVVAYVGGEVGCGCVEELMLRAPLVVSEGEGARGVVVQVVVEDADGEGRRGVSVYSRPDTATSTSTSGGSSSGASSGSPGGGEVWTLHATGVLAPTPVSAEGFVPEWGWPPSGEVVAVEGIYDRLAGGGFDYGPVFRGLRGVWRDGWDVFAEVVLPDDPAGYVVHPALLDAVLHALAVTAGGDGEVAEFEGGMPFAFSGVTVYRSGARTLHARLRRQGSDGVCVEAVDPSGQPVVTIDSLVFRPVSEAALNPVRDTPLRMRWDQATVVTSVAGESEPPGVNGEFALVGEGWHSGVDAALSAVESGADVPSWVILDLPDGGDSGTVPERARTATEWLLGQLQAFLAAPALADARMLIRTRGAVITGPGDRDVDPAVTAVWGLARSAAAENPDRIHLLDTDTTGSPGNPGITGSADSTDATDARDGSVLARPTGPTGSVVGAEAAGGEVGVRELLTAVEAAGREQLALRGGVLLAPRLVPLDDDVLSVPDGTNWRLTPGGDTLDGLRLVADGAAPTPLASGEVRVAVRAAGLNFRDVMVALGMYPGRAALGAEGAGVVTEVGSGVAELAVGDRVMGLMPECFGPFTTVDARMVAPVPGDWTFAEAASVPIVFLTAWYALCDLAGLRAGERVLVHAGAGGVGMAAVQVARYLGAEVFATAHPSKWGTLRALGVAEDHIASSRDLDFGGRFAEVTEEQGVDVVLNSLAGEFIDASLELLPRGGRFIEMGKTDVRDGTSLPPGVTYRTFDLADPPPERIGAMLSELLALLARGELEPLPRTTWDLRAAPAAFRYLGQAKHTGKLVLTVPTPLDPDGTVLVTGGTGTLGALVARHLVTEHGVRHLLLAGRRGPSAPEAAELVEELERLGAEVRVAACDVSRRDEVAALLDGVDPGHRLTGVVHAAGVADDAVIGSLTPERVATVLAAKAESAWHLHELTRDADLAMFTLFSSVAGLVGAPGQGNYAAANTFLDALAEHRHARGLPAQSQAWGLWAQRSGISGHLTDDDLARVARSGMVPLTSEAGLRMWDHARDRADLPHLALLQLDPRHRQTHPLLADPSGTAGRTTRARGATAGDGRAARERLATLTGAERRRALLNLVREHAAGVLGHPDIETVEDERAFKDLGFDSLTGIELRNRLNAAVGVSLRATLVFDHPTPAALADHLDQRVTADAGASATTGEADTSDEDLTEAEFRRALATIPFQTIRDAGLTGPLLRLARGDDRPPAEPEDDRPGEIDAMDADELIRIALDTLDD